MEFDNKKLKDILDSLPYKIFVSNFRNEIVYKNRNVEEYEVEHFKNKNPISYYIKNELPEIKIEQLNFDSKLRYFKILNQPLFDNEGTVDSLLTLISDVTELESVKQDLQNKELYDGLTGLYNRNSLNDKIQNLITRYSMSGKSSMVLFLDIDNFNHINSKHGYDVGDSLLVEISRKLKNLSEKDDHIVRYGGNSFVLLYENLTDDKTSVEFEAKNISVNLRNCINTELCLIKPMKQTVDVTCSIGYYIIDDDEKTAGDIKTSADTAMHRAKMLGRNKIVEFTPEFRKNIVTSLEIEKKLKKALKNKEFELYLQPQYHLDNNYNFILTGAEVLIRWNSEEGVLSPFYFIDESEKNGLIVDIGRFVLKESIKLLHTWSKDERLKHLTLSLNTSSQEFSDLNYISNLKKILEKYKINPALLQIEITENVAIDNFKSTNKKINKIKDMGINLSLDDFGTGYSSLSYISKIPFDEVKLDRSFVDNIYTCKVSEQIIRSVIDISKVMDKRLIIEGVEDTRQLHRLITMGAVNFQGFLFAKPMNNEEFLVSASKSVFYNFSIKNRMNMFFMKRLENVN